MNLQQQADDKKKQMKEDYKQIKESVKENPYLQAALLQYEEYFALQEKQIKALLLLSGTFYLGMGILANPQLLLPGIILELSALLMYLYHLIRP